MRLTGRGSPVTTDVSSDDRAETLLAMHGAILERVAGHEPLGQVLDALALAVEDVADGMIASILLVEDGRLRHGGAPSLPDAYNAAIDGVRIGPAVGSCGTAAYRGEPVIVTDVLTDPLWVDFRELAGEHGLRACWSTPITDRDGTVLGTFALYYRRPRTPDEAQARLIETATHLARIAIEHDRAERDLRESERRFRTVATQLPVGVFEADAAGQRVFVNERLCEMDGRALPELCGDGWLEAIHPEDRDRVATGWRRALAAEAAWRSEYRVLRPDGSIRHVSSQGVPLHGEDGTLSGMLGSAVDVTERKEAEEQRRVLERERLIAQTLQRSLLPAGLPGVEGLEVAARYLPGAAGMDVGGDWYDLFELPDGKVGVAIGDVTGRGAPAAAAMGQLRIALRTAAAFLPEPATVVQHMNGIAERDGHLATLVYGTLDPGDGRFHFVCAGHPPPLLSAPGAPGRYLASGRNPPVGAIEGAVRDDEITLQAGQTLLLYTDGLVERRDATLDAGLAELAVAAADHQDDPQALCDAVVDRLGAEAAGDDVALLAVRLAPRG